MAPAAIAASILANNRRPVFDGRVHAGEGPYLHSTTRLSDGRPSLLLGIGSVGHLTGDQWLKDTGSLAVRHGRRPEQYRRDRPLDVSGVGSGSTIVHIIAKPLG